MLHTCILHTCIHVYDTYVYSKHVCVLHLCIAVGHDSYRERHDAYIDRRFSNMSAIANWYRVCATSLYLCRSSADSTLIWNYQQILDIISKHRWYLYVYLHYCYFTATLLLLYYALIKQILDIISKYRYYLYVSYLWVMFLIICILCIGMYILHTDSRYHLEIQVLPVCVFMYVCICICACVYVWRPLSSFICICVEVIWNYEKKEVLGIVLRYRCMHTHVCRLLSSRDTGACTHM